MDGGEAAVKEMLSLPWATCDPRASVSPGTERMFSARTFQHFLPVTCRVSLSQAPPLGWFCSQ